MAANFSSVPVLDYALLSSLDTRPTFIAQLQHALINVGFLYLAHPPVAPDEFDALVAYIPRLFALPQARKDAIRMVHSPHFLGYSRLGAEMTKGAVDQREQFDFATPHENRWVPGAAEFLRLWGPSQVRRVHPRHGAGDNAVPSGQTRTTCRGSRTRCRRTLQKSRN